MADGDQPAEPPFPAVDTAPEARNPRRRECDNCGTRMRGRFCIACGQRDRHYGPIRCANCKSEKQGLFCAICGQNDRNYQRNAVPVVAEMLAETFETDSRLFTTLRVLFTRPGFLSAEFSHNRRARYLPPFRLYLFTSIVFFFLLSLNLPDGRPGTGENRPDILEAVSDDAPPRRLGRQAESDDSPEDQDGPSFAEVPPEITPEQQATVQRLDEILDPERRRKVREMLRRPVVGQVILGAIEGITTEDYAAVGRWGHSLAGQLVDILHRPLDAAEAWIENLPIAMFCLLPFYALLLKIVYIRRHRFYAEHLVFGMHIHTVAYMVFTVLVLIPDDVGIGWLNPLLLLALAVYYFLALKRYYGDGGFVTAIKFALLAFVYLWLLALALGGAAVAVLLFF